MLQPAARTAGARAIPLPALPWIEPGQRVRHPGQPEWGVGRVQSVIGNRVTVNFEHVGKRTMNVLVAPLDPVDDDEL